MNEKSVGSNYFRTEVETPHKLQYIYGINWLFDTISRAKHVKSNNKTFFLNLKVW